MTEQQERLVREIRAGQNPVCWHVLGQPLADELSAIVREQARVIDALRMSVDALIAVTNPGPLVPAVVSDNLLNDPALKLEGGAK